MIASRESIHPNLNAMYGRIRMAKQRNNLVSATAEFIKEIRTNPLLSKIRQSITKITQREIAPFIKRRQTLAAKLPNLVIAALENYTKIRPQLLYFLQESILINETYPPNSSKSLDWFMSTLDKVYILLKYDKSNSSLVAMPFISDGEEYTLQIIHHTLSRESSGLCQGLAVMDQTSLMYSMLWLSNLLEVHQTQSAIPEDLDIEKCKIHVQRVWATIKSTLAIKKLNKPNPPKFIVFKLQSSQITVEYGSTNFSFSTKDRTGRFVKAFHKKPYEPIVDKKLWSKVEENTSEQDFDGKAAKQLNETFKSVNKLFKKNGLPRAYQKTKKENGQSLPNTKFWFNSIYKIQID